MICKKRKKSLKKKKDRVQYYSLQKETIWHFTCEGCKGYWTIASMDAWQPSSLYCPHCGYTNSYRNKIRAMLDLNSDGEEEASPYQPGE